MALLVSPLGTNRTVMTAWQAQVGVSKARKRPPPGADPIWQPVPVVTKQQLTQPAATAAAPPAAEGKRQRDSAQPQGKATKQPQLQQGRQPSGPAAGLHEAQKRQKPLLRASLKGKLRPAGVCSARSGDTIQAIQSATGRPTCDCHQTGCLSSFALELDRRSRAPGAELMACMANLGGGAAFGRDVAICCSSSSGAGAVVGGQPARGRWRLRGDVAGRQNPRYPARHARSAVDGSGSRGGRHTGRWCHVCTACCRGRWRQCEVSRAACTRACACCRGRASR